MGKIQTRTYKERAQPLGRKKLGLLEKHKDYVLRARDFNSKRERLHSLKVKAQNRNPDEFYFRMESQKTQKGIHSLNSGAIVDEDVLKLLKTQDRAYITLQKQMERKKIEKTREELHSIFSSPNVHIEFEESDSVRTRKVKSKLSKSKSILDKEKELKKRLERLEKLQIVEDKLNLERNLASKGSKYKVGEDSRGVGIYKWKQVRQK